MVNHGMLVCSFLIKKRFAQETEDSVYSLNDTFEVKKAEDEDTREFSDIFELLQLFCGTNEALTDDTEKQKLFSVSSGSVQMYDEATYRAMSFSVRSGNYGVEAVMIDRRTRRETHRRSADEAAVMGFNGIVYVPKDMGDARVFKGILIFETIGIYGAKTVTTKYLKQFFAQYNLTFETRSVSVKVFIDKLIERGNLYRITLINNRVSSNRADNMLISSGREVTSYLQPRLKHEFLQNMLGWFDRADRTGICEIPSTDYDDISVTFKIDSHPRTVRLKNIDRMSIVEDIPEAIFEGRNNRERLIAYMIETADDYKTKMAIARDDGDTE